MYYYDDGRRKNIYVWLVVFFLIIIALATPLVKRFKLFHAARTLAGTMIYPFQYAGNAVYEGATSGTRNFFRLKGIQKENEQLKAQLDEYKAKQVLLDETARENERLRDALAFRARSYIPRLVAAEIIGRSSSNWFEMVEINRGSEDRVAADSAVINSEGLVGRVFEVSRYSSKVLLITDPASAVSVIDGETGDMGIASGNSIGPVKIKYMSATAALNVGDRIITSGMSDIFPKGIMVGHVKSVSKKDYDIFQKVDVAPAVNFSRLDTVFVVAR